MQPEHITDMRVSLLATALAALAILPGAADAGDAYGEAVNALGRGNAKYYPDEQITAANVARLKVVWRRPIVDSGFMTRFPDIEPSRVYQASPLIVGRMAYISDGVGLVEAFDAATGRTIWMQQPSDPGLKGAVGGQGMRGVAHWRDPVTGEARIISVRGKYLYAVDAATGGVIAPFGANGRVDLQKDSTFETDYVNTSGAVIVADVIVVGGYGNGGDFGNRKEAQADSVRGYDVRSGRRLWTFKLAPGPGDLGIETYEKDSWKITGAMGAWAQLAVDPDTGYVYVPTSAPSNSWYGGDHPGQNLFSDSILCLDARTGKRIWHRQLVHHDMWDYDVASPPTLGDITVAGQRIEAVFQPVKSGLVFVFDRRTGEPVWPIEERPVPPSRTPGEHAWPTQPFPTKPAPIDRVGITENDLIDFTPELHQEALAIATHYQLGPLYTPALIAGTDGKRGTISVPGSDGALSWNGGAFDPQTGIYYVTSYTHPWISDLVKPDPATGADLDYIHGPDAKFVENPATDFYYDRMYPAGPRGLPLLKPPYARITAIDMNRGDHLWAVANGAGPRNHPALRGLKLPRLGSSGRAPPMLTKTLLFVGEGSDSLVSIPRGMGGKHFAAYDKKTGALVWEIQLEAGTTNAPVSYTVDGHQYVVVAIGSAEHPSELLALALPEAQKASGTAMRPGPSQPVIDSVAEAKLTPSYSLAQAQEGAKVYGTVCQGCHLPNMGGTNTAKPLKGPAFADSWAGRTVRDLFARVHTTMPANDPGSLSDEQTVNVVAFLLQQNGYPASTQSLPTDRQKLRRMPMANAK